MDTVFCSLNSAALAEPLYGTAVHVDVWFLLEYRASWAARTTEENNLPLAVQGWLAEQLAAVGENGRLQFIKQGRGGADLAFFVAVMTGPEPQVYRFGLSRYEDLLTLDIAALLADTSALADQRHFEPLYLVCTHGKRDLCCAKFGFAFYQQLAAQVGEQAWQASHLGGHRFAVTALTLPDGVNYGRLLPSDIPALIAAQQDNTLLLDRLRGQTRYSPLVQTADYFLRQQTGARCNDAFTLHGVTQTAERQWQVAFCDGEKRPFAINLIQATTPYQILGSCGSPKMKTVYPYHLA